MICSASQSDYPLSIQAALFCNQQMGCEQKSSHFCIGKLFLNAFLFDEKQIYFYIAKILLDNFNFLYYICSKLLVWAIYYKQFNQFFGILAQNDFELVSLILFSLWSDYCDAYALFPFLSLRRSSDLHRPSDYCYCTCLRQNSGMLLRILLLNYISCCWKLLIYQ